MMTVDEFTQHLQAAITLRFFPNGPRDGRVGAVRWRAAVSDHALEGQRVVRAATDQIGGAKHEEELSPLVAWGTTADEACFNLAEKLRSLVRGLPPITSAAGAPGLGQG